jgi:flagellar basal body-associated protein FliL
MAYAPVNHVAPAKKMSTSMIVLCACLLGVVVGLFGLNFWHMTKCADSKSPDEIETYVEGINRRLLQAESQVCFRNKRSFYT